MKKLDTAQFFKLNPLEFTKAPLRAEQSISLNASPEKVWALVSDHQKVPTYLPMIEKVTVDNSNASTENGIGAIKHCSIGDMTWQEEVLLWNPDRAKAYGLPDGNPMGMNGHLAVVRLAANETGGTSVSWQFYFNHPDVDVMVAQTEGALQQGLCGLVEIFGEAPAG
jgi:carbon monoxide dehydrogenase subunit G